jgi:perosamine synthetase
MIPITTVRFGAEEESLVLEVLRSGQLAQGEYVDRFERLFAESHGVKHAIAVNNGTTSLVVALEALGLGPGDEVVTSPFTFVATLNAILEAGATARFADIGTDFNMLPEAVESLITPRTRAIMPVHLYGFMVDMAPMMDIAARHGLAVVEDAAQAVGASYRGRRAGSFGIGSFSLYATKNINTGEGGVVTTNDDAIADRVRLLRNQGMRQRYQYEVAGHNYRLTNLAAAVGLPQLSRLDEISAQRRRNAATLLANLSGVPGLELPEAGTPERSHVFHQFTIRVTDRCRVRRDDVVAQVNEAGVGCGIYYPKVVFDYDCYRQDRRVICDDVPHAFKTASQVISLPVHPNLSESDLTTIVDVVRTVVSS